MTCGTAVEIKKKSSGLGPVKHHHHNNGLGCEHPRRGMTEQCNANNWSKKLKVTQWVVAFDHLSVEWYNKINTFLYNSDGPKRMKMKGLFVIITLSLSLFIYFYVCSEPMSIYVDMYIYCTFVGSINYHHININYYSIYVCPPCLFKELLSSLLELRYS